MGISAMVHLLVTDSVNAGLNKGVLSDIKVPATYESVIGVDHSFKEVEVGSWLELNEMVQPEKMRKEALMAQRFCLNGVLNQLENV